MEINEPSDIKVECIYTVLRKINEWDILSIYLIDRFGRVLLLIISGIGMTITLGLTSGACYVIEN